MKLERQVCSFELAKRLKGLGVEQDSLWWWAKEKGREPEYWRLQAGSSYIGQPVLSAFTVAELGELLEKEAMRRDWDSKKTANLYARIAYQRMNSPSPNHEANARAKWLVTMIEPGNMWIFKNTGLWL